MKKTFSRPLLLIFVLLLLSFKNGGLLNNPIPLLPNKTLDGKTIDENYYKGHVTIVSFMYIGCAGCMNEISTLNKIKAEYANNEQLQILCIARQMRDQMISFNGYHMAKFDTSKPMDYSYIRKAMNTDSIQYTILPACADAKSTMVKNGNEFSIKSECSTIEEKYGVTTFPTTLYVDKKGIVRQIHVGGPPTKDAPEFYNEIKKQIDLLSAE